MAGIAKGEIQEKGHKDPGRRHTPRPHCSRVTGGNRSFDTPRRRRVHHLAGRSGQWYILLVYWLGENTASPGRAS